MKEDEKSLGENEAEYNAAEKEYEKLGGLGAFQKFINNNKLLSGIFEKRKEYEQKPETIAKKIDRMEAMLAESDIGRKSLDILKKGGYSFDFNYDDVTAPHVDTRNKKVMLNSQWSMETGALSLVHAARTVWQQKTGKAPRTFMTINAYLARAEVCQADALVTQLAFAEEMEKKNPNILKMFIKNGNKKLYEAYRNNGRDKEAVIDTYIQEKSFRKEDWINASIYSLGVALRWTRSPKRFIKNETMQDIKSSVCVNYDDTVYAVGKKEPARFSGMMFRGNVEMMDLPIIACDYMNKFQRSAESMGLQDVEFKDNHFTKAVYEYEGTGLKRFKGYTYQSINLAEKCQYYTDVRYKKKDTAKNAQNNAAALKKMKQGGR